MQKNLKEERFLCNIKIGDATTIVGYLISEDDDQVVLRVCTAWGEERDQVVAKSLITQRSSEILWLT